MRIVVHADAREFADRVRPLLAAEEALNALPLGLLDQPASPGSDGRFAAAVGDHLAERVGGAARPTMRMRAMACTRLRPYARPPGAARAIGTDDVGWVAAWLWAFEDEAGLPHLEPTLDATRASVAREVDQGRSPLWVWRADGDPVSLAGIGRPTPSGERIGPVYTPPPHRGRGYAGALVGQLTARAFERRRRRRHGRPTGACGGGPMTPLEARRERG